MFETVPQALSLVFALSHERLCDGRLVAWAVPPFVVADPSWSLLLLHILAVGLYSWVAWLFQSVNCSFVRSLERKREREREKEKERQRESSGYGGGDEQQCTPASICVCCVTCLFLHRDSFTRLLVSSLVSVSLLVSGAFVVVDFACLVAHCCLVRLRGVRTKIPLVSFRGHANTTAQRTNSVGSFGRQKLRDRKIEWLSQNITSTDILT